MAESADHPGSSRVKFSPRPVPLADVRRQLEMLRALPELACTDAWTQACEAWWHDDHDRRLRRRALDVLLLGDEELGKWLARDLDRKKLEDAHRHVTSQRAGLERDLSRRQLTASSLRTREISADHRSGDRTLFVPAEELPAQIEILSQIASQLDPQPILRASWMLQAVGAVHPFTDANGGTSRFLASLELVRRYLPPLVLSGAQRNRNYIEALLESNSGNLENLATTVHEITQGTIGNILLAGDAEPAAWDAASSERASQWIATAAALWREHAGEDTTANEDAGAVTRIARRGVRLPIAPAPRCATWRSGATLLDLIVTPVRGGPRTWLIATVSACIGETGEVGADYMGEPVTAIFIAPSNEGSATVEARLRSWLDTRFDQCVRGIALWM